MRSSTSLDFVGRCRGCYLPLVRCLCAEVPRIATRTEVLVIRHHKERHKSTNTARLAALALERCRLLPYGSPGDDFEPSVLAQPRTWIVFPEAPEPEPDAPPPERLVVLDGSWAQARRMYQRIPGLLRLPGIALAPPTPGSRRLRQPPHPYGMSTLEAIAGALALLEGEDVARPLYQLHEMQIDRVLAGRGDGPLAASAADDDEE